MYWSGFFLNDKGEDIHSLKKSCVRALTAKKETQEMIYKQALTLLNRQLLIGIIYLPQGKKITPFWSSADMTDITSSDFFLNFVVSH